MALRPRLLTGLLLSVVDKKEYIPLVTNSTGKFILIRGGNLSPLWGTSAVFARKVTVTSSKGKRVVMNLEANQVHPTPYFGVM